MEENRRKKIALVLPRGEAIRNFVQSGMAAYLRKYAHLTIISIIPNEEIELLLRKNCDDFYELSPSTIPYFIKLLWDWIDVVHGRWLWSGAAKMRWKIRNSEKKPIDKKIKRSIKKIFAFPFANRVGIEFLTYTEALFFEKLVSNHKYKALLKKIRPEIVFNGSQIHSRIARPIMHAARMSGIKTATFLFSWDNLTSQGRIFPRYDFYLVWNEQIKEEFLRIYKKTDAKQVYVTGTPQFDFHFRKEPFMSREEYAKKIGIDHNKPIILYTTGMLNLMPEEDIIVDRLAEICSHIVPTPQLVVRLYPKDPSGRFEYLKEKRGEIFFPKIEWEPKYFTPMPKDIELYSNMLFHCDVGINIASTVSLELCMFEKPVINIGYNPSGIDISPKDFRSYYQWEHYKPLTDSGAIDIVWDEKNMEQAIVDNLNAPTFRASQRKKLIKDFFGLYLDGRSYIRVAEKLLDFAGAED